MPGMSAASILDLWDRAERLDPVERALALAAGGDPAGGTAEAAALPLGRRDARLLRLRTELAGETLEATAPCPQCGEVVEFAADANELLAREDGEASAGRIEERGFVVSWRLPDSRDFAAAAGAGDAAGGERVLLERCVTAAAGPDGELTGAALPARVREAVSNAMAAADPLAE